MATKLDDWARERVWLSLALELVHSPLPFDDGRRCRTGGAEARDWLDAGRHPSGLSLITPHPTSNGAYRMMPLGARAAQPR